MRRWLTVIMVTTALIAPACSGQGASFEIKPGTDVTLQKKDGVTVTGRLVDVKPNHVVVETRAGTRMEVPRVEISTLRADTSVATAEPKPVSDRPVGSMGAAAESPAPPPNAERASAPPRSTEYREVTIPAGTILPLELKSAVASDSSRVEDPVRAALRRPVTVGGIQVLPAGTSVLGHVTAAERSARVKGRARVAFRFTSVDVPGNAERVSIRTDTVSRLAPATKKHDAAKIGGGAVGGAIIGGIVGGGGGAAKGAAAGGAAGTGVVLATRGKEVRLGPGAPLSVRLAAPVTLRVAVNR
jgi:hypothetical protein